MEKLIDIIHIEKKVMKLNIISNGSFVKNNRINLLSEQSSRKLLFLKTH